MKSSEKNKERRRSRRIRRRLNATLSGKNDKVFHAQTVDVSSFGFRLILEPDVSIAKDDHFSILFNEINSVADVRVVWVDQRPDCVFAGIEKVLPRRGNIKTTALTDVLFALMDRRFSGELRFSRGSTKKSIFIDIGNIIFADSNQEFDTLPALLVRTGKISQKEFDQVWAAHMKHPDEKLEKLLVDFGYLNTKDFGSVSVFRSKEIVKGLFGWSEGEFELIDNQVPPTESPRLDISSADLIISGTRRISPDRLKEMLAPVLDIPLSISMDPLHLFQSVRLTDEEKAVMQLVDGRTSISNIIEKCGFSEGVALVAISVLTGAYLVELGESIPEGEIPEAGTSEEGESISEAVEIESRIDRMHFQLDRKNHYEILAVTPSAGYSEIRKAYYSKARDFHPDLHHRLGSGYESKLNDIFSRINDAHDLLSDESRRKKYDETLAPHRVGSGASLKKGKREKQSAGDLYKWGNIKYGKGEYAASAEMFRMAARLEPEKGLYHFAAGKALSMLSKRLKEAEECFLKSVEKEPYNSRYLLELGKLYLKARLPTRAKKTFTEVLNMDADNDAARKGLEAINKIAAKR